jgi:hypothetical protein
MKRNLTGAAGMAAAFVAGMVVATALIGGIAAARATPRGITKDDAGAKQHLSVQAGIVDAASETNFAETALQSAAQQSAAANQQVIVEKGIIRPTVTDEDIALLRQDLRARKMQVIGQNMALSDEEGQRFWPIYNHYVKDLTAVNDQKYALLKQYAEMWETMSDQEALIYVRHWLEVDGQAQALRLKYVPVVSQALPGRKAATFFQLDRRLNMIVDLQLFGQIPLAHVKEVGPNDTAHP